MPTRKIIWIVLAFCLCLALTACKVITPTPPADAALSADGILEPGEKALPNPQPVWYVNQADAPSYIPNGTPAGCDWMGLAGQAFDSNGAVLLNYKIVVSGSIGDQAPMETSALTGTSSKYGPGGYEMDLATSPVNSSGTLWVQLFDPNGKAVSNKYPVNTYQDCQKNLIIMNYYPRGAPRMVLPFISK
ncbi:MAG TPA: hypothetical protein VHO48_03340 [Anaerolineaceae bacterium]|nr:hypothetical protein [Anaerolineaceae bacterium]